MNMAVPQTLGTVITITKGRKHELSEQPSANSKRLIGIDDLRNDTVIRYTDDARGTESKPKDVLIAWDGANAGTIGFGKSGFIGSTIARLRIKNDINLFTPFLGLFLKSKFNYLRQTATGATIPHINRAALEGIPLPQIDFDDQIRIAHLLSKVEGLISQRKQHLKQLDELLKSVFLEMFGDPVRNEKGHKISLLGTFITHLTSGGRGWAKYYAKSGKRFIRSFDVQMNSIGSNDIVYVNPPNNKETERTKVQPNDVLLTITGSKIGRVCFVPDDIEEAYISQHVAIIRTKGINPIYLSYYLSMPNCGQRIIAKNQYGQAKPGLNFKQISEFEILEPDLAMQQKFTSLFDKVEGIKARYQTSLAELEILYGVLSQRAFKAELDLSRVILPPDIQQPPKNVPAKVERITVQETLDKISRITSPIDKIMAPIWKLNPMISNPAFQSAQRIHKLTNLGSISQYLNSGQFASLGETAHQLAAFRANLPTMNFDQLSTWSKLSSRIADITRPYQSVLDSLKPFEKFTEQDWTKLGIEWAFNNYLDEMDDEPFTIEKCAVFIEDQLHNEEEEEPFKLLQQHYEHIKTQIFKALDDGRLIQNYHGQENRVCVFRNKEAEA